MKANTCAAKNDELHRTIDELRGQRLQHLQHKQQLQDRVRWLDKEVPLLLDKTSHDLHEGEKLHGKLMLAQQESETTRSQQSRLLRETAATIQATQEQIVSEEARVYERQQKEMRKAYLLGKQLRAALTRAETRLGYLNWKATWWSGEFERLQQATHGVRYAPGKEIAIKEITQQFLVLSQRNDSLVGYLQQQQVEQMHLERELRATRAHRQKVQAKKKEQSEAVPLDQLQEQVDEVAQRSQDAETQLLSMGPLIASQLRLLMAAAEAGAPEEAVFLTETAAPADAEVAAPAADSDELQPEAAVPAAAAAPPAGLAKEMPRSALLETTAALLEDPQNAGKLVIIEKGLAVLQDVVHDLTEMTRRMVAARQARLDALSGPYGEIEPEDEPEPLPHILQQWGSAGPKFDEKHESVKDTFKQLLAEAAARKKEEEIARREAEHAAAAAAASASASKRGMKASMLVRSGGPKPAAKGSGMSSSQSMPVL